MSLTPEQIIQFREAMKKFAVIVLERNFDSGIFDKYIEGFLNGDELTIKVEIDLLANDVIFMRSLIGADLPEDVMDKVKQKWKEGK